MNVRTRIAPSPTGFAHIGTIYQVLFDYAYAKKHNGQFLVRIEDTDRQRFVEGAENVVMNAISWFGLEEDESPRKGGAYGPYRQSERLEIYKKYADELIEKGHAFYCFCSKERLEEMRKQQEANKQAPMYDGHCLSIALDEATQRVAAGESHVVRMKIPRGETITVHDELVGDVSFESDTIDMQVLIKGDGFPTYHLGVVVDDYLMKVTHIFRGREWLPSTPKHVLLYRYFGWELPTYIHLPLLLNSDRPGKLSKRYGHATVSYYQQLGYLPEAILNYLSLIVWKHPDGQEIYDLEEFIRLFEIKDITSQGPKFDLAKLNWLNGVWIRKMSDDVLVHKLTEGFSYAIDPEHHDLWMSKELPSPNTLKTETNSYALCTVDQVRLYLPLVKDRLTRLLEFNHLVAFFLFSDVVDVLKHDLILLQKNQLLERDNLLEVWQSMMLGKNLLPSDVAKILQFTIQSLEGHQVFDPIVLESNLRDYFSNEGYKNADAFMAIRVALTGRTATPPLTDIMRVLGKEKVLARLSTAMLI